MTQASETSALGPIVFVALSLYTLVTATPADPPPNPAHRMDMANVARGQTLAQPVLGTGPGALPAILPITRATPPALAALAALAADRATDAGVNAIFLPPPPIAVFQPRPNAGFLGPSDWADRPALPGRAGADDELPPHAAPPLIEATDTPEAAPASARSASAPRPKIAAQTLAQAMADSQAATTLTRLPLSLTTPFRPWLVPMPGPARADTAPPAQQNWYAVNAQAVHLRRAPKAISPFYTRLNIGDRVIGTESRGNWIRVLVPDSRPPRVGWMYSRYLDPVDPPAASGTPNRSN